VRLLLVGLGGFVGAVARYVLSGLAHRLVQTTFPVGTLAVNALGCLALGAIMFLVDTRQAITPETRVFATIGVLGSFTTFSTFGYETVEMLRHGAFRPALGNVAGNLLIGMAAVVAGWSIARAIWH